MPKRTPLAVDVCANCVAGDANGVASVMLDPGEPTPLAALPNGYCLTPDERTHVCDGHFSHYPCGTCGSTLGGTRYCYLLHRVPRRKPLARVVRIPGLGDPWTGHHWAVEWRDGGRLATAPSRAKARDIARSAGIVTRIPTSA